MTPRSAVLWVPDWPIVAAGTDGVLDPHAPAAVYDGRGIVAASGKARAAGVRTGMTRRRAQQICPELTLVATDENRDARHFEAVVQASEEVIAFPVVLRAGMLMADAAGPTRHHGSEEALADGLIGAIARESGAESYAGIADGLLAAILAARQGVIVPPGGSAQFLASAAVHALNHAAFTKAARTEMNGLIQVLIQLGLTNLGALAALPPADMASRFGAIGVRAHALASGQSAPVVSGTRPLGAIVVTRELDPPIERSDAAAFAARTLAEELAARLGGRVTARLHITARTTDSAELSRVWTIEAPLSASDATDRVRWQLDGWLSGRSGRPPSAPLHVLELVAEDVRGASDPVPLWGREERTERAARRAMVRLQGMLGTEGVLRPVLEGGRDPRTRVRLVVSGDDEVPLRRTDAPWPGRLPAPSPSTMYDQPRPARLSDAAGVGVIVDSRGQLSAPPTTISYVESQPETVIAWAGPWPISERWWDSPRRAAWLQVTASEGPALLLSSAGGTWQVEGAYD